MKDCFFIFFTGNKIRGYLYQNDGKTIDFLKRKMDEDNLHLTENQAGETTIITVLVVEQNLSKLNDYDINHNWWDLFKKFKLNIKVEKL